jgi:Fe-S oxidoreductase
MLDVRTVKEEFASACTGCGRCVECCPIIENTDLRGVDPRDIMGEILDLFRHDTVGDLARERIYSCLFCNTCVTYCPEGLSPSLSFGVGKGILREIGDPVPIGVSSIQETAGGLIESVLPSFGENPGKPDWLITDLSGIRPQPARTILFSSCFGLIQRDTLLTTFKILQRIDPAVRVFGGYDYCCGELQFMAGRPDEARTQFAALIEGLNTLSPEEVVIFCPTCNMNFDHHSPDTSWSRTFITDFIAAHLDELGPLGEVRATVTVHDPCHFVRGEKPGSDSPREILRAIPGIEIMEMKNTGENTLCCGAYAITGMGEPGKDFRGRRLRQAKDTGADILSLYCPGCQLVLAPGGAKLSLEVESILTLLGRSLGIG